IIITPLKGVRAAVALLALCCLPACGEEKEATPDEGALGSACDLGKISCNDDLLCTEGEDGDGVCTLLPGAECEPGSDEVDNGGCALTATCEEPSEEGDAGADGAATCRINEGEECDPDEDFCT